MNRAFLLINQDLVGMDQSRNIAVYENDINFLKIIIVFHGQACYYLVNEVAQTYSQLDTTQ